jgi:uncharacterized protein involved in exopolysaccharide biosynthesis
MSQTPIIEELFSILLKRKRFLLTVVLVFVLLGAVVAIFSPKEYVSKTIILPQISSSQGLGQKLGGFAKLVGLNFAENSKNEIFPTLYPVIANSIPFQKEVLSSHVVDAVTGDSLRVTEYLSDINLKGPTDYLKEYTIGLPGKVVGIFKSEQEETPLNLTDTTIVKLSEIEKEQIEYLEENISVTFNEVEGYIEIYSMLPDAAFSAQLTKNVQVLLQNYIIEFNISKAKDELDYLEKRHEEAKTNYDEKRNALGRFRDQNKNYIRSAIENRYEQLKTENDLAFSVYSQLSSELETAKLQVKRDTPIFTILKPVSIPPEPTGPNKALILFGYALLGFFLGSGFTLFKTYWPSIKSNLSQSNPK